MLLWITIAIRTVSEEQYSGLLAMSPQQGQRGLHLFALLKLCSTGKASRAVEDLCPVMWLSKWGRRAVITWVFWRCWGSNCGLAHAGQVLWCSTTERHLQFSLKIFKTGSHYIVLAGLEIPEICPPLPATCWDRAYATLPCSYLGFWRPSFSVGKWHKKTLSNDIKIFPVRRVSE